MVAYISQIHTSDSQGPIIPQKSSRRLKVIQKQRREQPRSIVDNTVSYRNKIQNSSLTFVIHTCARQKVKQDMKDIQIGLYEFKCYAITKNGQYENREDLITITYFGLKRATLNIQLKPLFFLKTQNTSVPILHKVLVRIFFIF